MLLVAVPIGLRVGIVPIQDWAAGRLIIVYHARKIRSRVVVLQCESLRREQVARDDVSREWQCSRVVRISGQRVIDRSSVGAEVTIALVRGRHRIQSVSGSFLIRTVKAEEVKELVLLDRTTNRGAVVVV